MPEGTCYWNPKNYDEVRRAPPKRDVLENCVKVRSEMASSSKVRRLPCVLRGYHVYSGIRILGMTSVPSTREATRTTNAQSLCCMPVDAKVVTIVGRFTVFCPGSLG